MNNNWVNWLESLSAEIFLIVMESNRTTAIMLRILFMVGNNGLVMTNNWVNWLVPLSAEIFLIVMEINWTTAIMLRIFFMVGNKGLMMSSWWLASVVLIESRSMTSVMFFEFRLFIGVLLFCDVMFLFNNVSLVMFVDLLCF